jgi:hypothetical protein
MLTGSSEGAGHRSFTGALLMPFNNLGDIKVKYLRNFCLFLTLVIKGKDFKLLP